MAVARQMLIIIRRMLVRGEPFRDRHHSRPSPYSFSPIRGSCTNREAGVQRLALLKKHG